MKKWFIYVMAILLPLPFIYAQTAVHPLHTGDSLPPVQLQVIENGENTVINTSSLQGKAVILDFFATWCGSCISALERLDSLQRIYTGDLRILVVCYEPPSKIRSFLARHPTAKQLQLPFITGDSILKRLFPHTVFPHEVWIAKNGTVQAITEGKYVDRENVASFIEGKTLRLPVKEDVFNYDHHHALLENGNGGGLQTLIHRSVLTRHLDGARNISGSDTTNPYIKRLFYINAPVLDLYMHAVHDAIPPNRILLETADSARFLLLRRSWDEWSLQHTYCYELTIPAGTDAQHMEHIFLSDLNTGFGWNGRIEKREMTCYLLLQTAGSDSLLRTNKGPAQLVLPGKNKTLLLQNQTLDVLTAALNNCSITGPWAPIILNETNFKGKVDMSLAINRNYDLPSLRKALQTYGLHLVQTKREMDVFVLSDNSK